MKPIIGIVSRPGITESDSLVHSVEEFYKNAVIEFGGIPILILPTQNIVFANSKSGDIPTMTESEKEDLNRILDLCDGIIVPGGKRVYEYDLYICKYAFDNDIPILGICAGMQTMAKINNNDNTNELIPEENHYLDESDRHIIEIKKDTMLYDILKKDSIEVNSFHKYRISSNGIYKIGATSDNCIEAIEYDNNKFYIGVQWHPERMIDNDSSRKLFEKFIECTKKMTD